MTEPRRATPTEAKAVWDSMPKPSVRAVATALTQAGFSPVSHKTVHRWKERKWAEPKANAKAPPLDHAAQQLEAAVPVMTGDAKTRIADVNGSDPGSPLAARRAELEQLSDDQILKKAARDTFINVIMLGEQTLESEKIREMMADAPDKVTNLQKALAGSLAAATSTFAALIALQERMLPPLNAPTDVTPAKQIEADPLSNAFAAYDKAIKGE